MNHKKFSSLWKSISKEILWLKTLLCKIQETGWSTEQQEQWKEEEAVSRSQDPRSDAGDCVLNVWAVCVTGALWSTAIFVLKMANLRQAVRETCLQPCKLWKTRTGPRPSTRCQGCAFLLKEPRLIFEVCIVLLVRHGFVFVCLLWVFLDVVWRVTVIGRDLEAVCLLLCSQCGHVPRNAESASSGHPLMLPETL